MEDESLVTGLEGEECEKLFGPCRTLAPAAGTAALCVVEERPGYDRYPRLATPHEARLGGREAAERGGLVIEVVAEGVHEGAKILRPADGVGIAGRDIRFSGEAEEAVVAERPHGHTASLVAGDTTRRLWHPSPTTSAVVGARGSVKVVDQHNFHTFQPLLYEVATAGLDPADVAYPIRTNLRRAPNLPFILGRVAGLDEQYLEIVVEVEGFVEAVHETLVVGHDAAGVRDDHLVGSQRHLDPPADELDGHRVLALADPHPGLGVDLGHGHEVVAPEETYITLSATCFVSPLYPRGGSRTSRTRSATGTSRSARTRSCPARGAP